MDQTVMPAGAITAEAAGEYLWDVLVIGAGPAGSLVSRQAAMSGMRVLLVDRCTFPRDKVCGGCLSAKTLAALDAAGAGECVARLGGREVHRLRLGGWGRVADLPLPTGLSLSRRALDASLVEHAVGAGVLFLPASVATIGHSDGERRRVVLQSTRARHEVAARVVIDASGLGSELIALDAVATGRAGARIGCSATIEASGGAYPQGAIFMAVDKAGYVGAVRLEDGRLNVAAALDPEVVRRDGPGKVAAVILRSAGFDSVDELTEARWSGTPRLGRRPRRLAAERVFAIGDAAGYVEPFTGEGIGWAARSAALLSPLVERAVEQWTGELVAVWSGRYRLEQARSQRACRMLARLLRRPGLARMAIRALERRPGLGAPFVHHLHAPHLQRGGTA